MKVAPTRHAKSIGTRRIGSAHQRGAIGILGAITLLLAFAFLALAIDTGRLWMERRNLQKMADMAAMAAVRYTGCGGSPDLIRSTALDTVRNNGLASALSDGSASITTTYGTLSVDTQKKNVYTASTSSSTLGSYATRVSLTHQVPTSIVLGGMFNAPLTMTAVATAKGGPPTVTFTQNAQIFSYTAFSNFWQNAFKGKTAPTASVLQQLAASSINLSDLMKASGFSTVDQLANSNMTLQTLLQNYSNAVAQGQGDPAVTSALANLINAVGSNGTSIPLSQILALNNGGNKDALLSADINLLGLFQTSVSVLGKQSVFDLGLSGGDIASVRIKLGDIPPLAIGPGGVVDPSNPGTSAKCTSVKSQDVTLALGVSPTKNSSILAPIFKLIKGLVDITVDLEVGFHFGNATTYVDYIEPTPGTAKLHFNTDTSLARITYTKTDAAENVPGEFSIKLLSIPIAAIYVGTPTASTSSSGGQTWEILVPTPIHENNNLPYSKPGTSELAGVIHGLLQSVPDVSIQFFGGIIKIDLGAIANAITSVVGTFLEPILASTIDPILRGLGVNIGSGYVTVYDIQNIEPQLVQ